MNAVPNELLRQTEALSETVVAPIAGSRKIHVDGSADVRVPMREVPLADTPMMFGAEQNAAVVLYDTSGPYTDPSIAIDLSAGLGEVRAAWIEGRGDTDRLAGLTSEFGRQRAFDARLRDIRFPRTHAPRRSIHAARTSARPADRSIAIEGSVYGPDVS